MAFALDMQFKCDVTVSQFLQNFRAGTCTQNETRAISVYSPKSNSNESSFFLFAVTSPSHSSFPLLVLTNSIHQTISWIPGYDFVGTLVFFFFVISFVYLVIQLLIKISLSLIVQIYIYIF